ncbi:hypothetical protein ACERII_25045 [Evansella sp. AB-rgal1]|uniref:DUF6944 family repetitive protein n=1 Tax=Evansella sp. AB-rgal1 TaxID=3242696 RepID=UPI00359E1799
MASPIMYIIGNWIEAIGATIAAMGVSIEIQDSTDGKKTRIVGDAVQGIGNFMIAEAEVEDRLAEVGNIIQGIASSGNAAIAYRELKMDDDLNHQLEVISDAVQAFGSYITAIARSDDNPPKAFGNGIQSFGAIIEASGVLNKLYSNEEKGDHLRSVGKWIQAIGTIIQALAVTPGLEHLVDIFRTQENTDD